MKKKEDDDDKQWTFPWMDRHHHGKVITHLYITLLVMTTRQQYDTKRTKQINDELQRQLEANADFIGYIIALNKKSEIMFSRIQGVYYFRCSDVPTQTPLIMRESDNLDYVLGLLGDYFFRS